MSASNSGIELHGTHGAAEGEEIVSVAAPVGDAAAGPVSAGTLVSEAAAAAGAIAGLALTTGTISSALPDDALTAAIGKMKKKQAELRNQKNSSQKICGTLSAARNGCAPVHASSQTKISCRF